MAELNQFFLVFSILMLIYIAWSQAKAWGDSRKGRDDEKRND